MFVFGVLGKNKNEVKTVTRTIGKSLFLAKAEVQDTFWHENGKYIGMVKTDKEPIISRQNEEFDTLVILDNTDTKYMGRHLKNNAVLLFNSKAKPSVSFKDKKVKTMFLDASSLSVSLKCDSCLLMLGASTKLYSKLSLKSVKDVIQSNIIEEGFKMVK